MGNQALLEVRNSRAVGLILLAIGPVLAAVSVFWEPANRPFVLVLSAVTAIVGLWRLLDRRVRLRISTDGILYRDWSNTEIPWGEFIGYERVSWRNNTYIQFVPRQPERLMKQFSPIGRLNQRAGRVVGMPEFSIAPVPLAVSDSTLEDVIAHHVSRVPAFER